MVFGRGTSFGIRRDMTAARFSLASTLERIIMKNDFREVIRRRGPFMGRLRMDCGINRHFPISPFDGMVGTNWAVDKGFFRFIGTAPAINC